MSGPKPKKKDKKDRMDARARSDIGTKGAGEEPVLENGKKFHFIYLYLGLILVGIVLRIFCTYLSIVGWDGTFYIAMGDQFQSSGFSFTLPWGDLAHSTTEPTYSHHYSPLFPIYLSAWFAIGGCSIVVAKVASFFISLVAILVVFICTKDLFGKENGLMAAAIVSLDPMIIETTGTILAENFILVLFTLTMWAILRGIKDDRYIILAGLFAGLTYLSKASMGYFFIIAGLGGLGWRFYYMRWSVFRNRSYMIAIAIFGALVGGWSLRNLWLFGWPNWETSAYVSFAINEALKEGLGTFLVECVIMGIFFFAVIMRYMLYWHKEVKASAHKIRDERVSCLWLSIVLIPITSLFIVTGFAMVEPNPPYNYDRMRYLFLMEIPIIWLMANELKRSDHVLIWKAKGKELGKRLSGLIGFREQGKVGRGAMIALLAGICTLFVVVVLHSGWSLFVLSLGGLCCLFVRSWKGRFLVSVLVALIVSVNVATVDKTLAHEDGAEYLEEHIEPGDVVAFDPPRLYELYFYYQIFYDHGEPRDNVTMIIYHEGCNASYILSSDAGKEYGENYTLVAKLHDRVKSNGMLTDDLASLLGKIGIELKAEKDGNDTSFIWERKG